MPAAGGARGPAVPGQGAPLGRAAAQDPLGASPRVTRLAAAVAGSPHALIGGHDEGPPGLGAVPWGRGATVLPWMRLMAFGALEPQAQGLQFGMAPGALEAQADAGVERVGRLAPIRIDDEGVRHGPEIAQPVPIGLGAREAGGLQGDPRPDRSPPARGHEPVHVAPAWGGGAAVAEGLIQEPDLAASPAPFDGPLRQGRRPFGPCAMGGARAWGRLAAGAIGVAGRWGGRSVDSLGRLRSRGRLRCTIQNMRGAPAQARPPLWGAGPGGSGGAGGRPAER